MKVTEHKFIENLDIVTINGHMMRHNRGFSEKQEDKITNTTTEKNITER